MNRIMLKSKIHNATVTESNIDYEGSLSLDEDLMQKADMVPNEQIHVYNISNGERFITYLIKAEKDSGIIGVNGAAARKAKAGDKIIIATYVSIDENEIDFFNPTVLIMDEGNKIKSKK